MVRLRGLGRLLGLGLLAGKVLGSDWLGDGKEIPHDIVAGAYIIEFEDGHVRSAV